ncbi:nucleosome-destabilizing factor [Rhodnius prolixus]
MALYKRGDLVWAKMKGFPPWPGIITAPPPELKKQPSKKATLYHCIFFFGTKNYSWIETHKLERYKKGAGNSGAKRSAALREACAAIEAYIENGEGASNFNITPEDDAFDKLVSESKASERPLSPSKPKSKKSGDDSDDGTNSDSSSGIESVKEFPSLLTKSDTKKSSNAGSSPASSPSRVLVSSSPSTVPFSSQSVVPISSPSLAPTSEQTPSTQSPVKEVLKVVASTKDTPKQTSSSDNEKENGTITGNESEEVTANEDEDPLKMDTVIDLAESSSSSGETPKPFVAPDFKSPTQNKSATSSSSKKKQVQQIVRARPFRQLAKPRSVERKSASNDGESRSSSTASSTDTSSNKKRSGTTASSQESSPSEAKKKKRQLYSDADTTTPMFHPHAHSYARRGPAAHLLDRPPNITRPETPPLDLFSVSQTLLDKHITPSPLRFGFLGLGIMGSGMVKNLLNSGHRVIVWNRSPEKSREFAKVGAEMAVTPQDVCSAADITFSCVSGPKAAKDMVFGNCGALREMNSTKAYVEMTNIDKETSLDIAEAVTSRGARYLEAQIQGSKAEADEGTLVILTAGDRSLYNECHSCFEAFGRSSFFLGEVGNASKMNLVIQMIAGITLAGLAEGLALADRCGLQQSDILEVISMTSLKCPMISEKGKCITECSFPTSLALSHMQKDLKLGLKLGDELEQPLPMTAMANEVYKHSKRLGYGDHDASAVYIRARF